MKVEEFAFLTLVKANRTGRIRTLRKHDSSSPQSCSFKEDSVVNAVPHSAQRWPCLRTTPLTAGWLCEATFSSFPRFLPGRSICRDYRGSLLYCSVGYAGKGFVPSGALAGRIASECTRCK